MNTNKGFTVTTEAKATSTKKSPVSKHKILISFLTIAVLCFSILFYGYISAPEKAENLAAIRFTQIEIDKMGYEYNHFLSFDKVYSVVSFSKFGYKVDLSGTINITIGGGAKAFKNPFSVTVYIPIIGKSTISNININGEKYK